MQAVWIEFPAKDLDRAMAFYQTVFDLQPTEIVDDGVRRTTTLVSMTPKSASPGISLNQTANFEPSNNGAYVYLDVGPDLTPNLARVVAAGGTVIAPKTSMGDAGNYATVLDTEGNLLGLYSYG